MGCKTALVILLITIAGQSAPSVRAAGEGGPSGFGYDAASACGKPYSRVGRARLGDIPCDFRRENWCTIAGNAYPWHAVRRFVQENQGLMRRMYGDEKHISVLKTELDKNDVEIEFEDEQNHLYTEDSSSPFKQFQFEVDYEFDQNQEQQELVRNQRNRGRSLSSGTTSKLDKPRDPEDTTYRYSHPNETPVSSTTYSTSSSSSSSTTSSSSTSSSTPTTSSTTTSTAKTSHRTKMTPVTPTTTTKRHQASSTLSTSTARTTMDYSTSSTSTSAAATTSTASTTTTTTSAKPIVSLSQIAKIQNLSINEVHGQIDRFDADVDELTEIPEVFLQDGVETTLPPDDDDDEDEMTVSGLPYPSSSERTDVFDDQDALGSESQQQFRPRPEYRPPEAAKPDGGASMEGQLFQDVAAKDKNDPPVLKVRGINACPVKEEVVAPFWANNTRGEVLALLNLYPFEQYVHWEKCTHENKQMYCRDGCRCEQQYRLHRLLAYDPNNECRGIFSDWFKFPSCCICRCYDLPIEFRVTSRSPRNMLEKTRIKVKAPKAPVRRRYN